MSSKSVDFAFKLPVDEDDYLMPSPGPTRQNSNYMDLIGDAKRSGNYHDMSCTRCDPTSKMSTNDPTVLCRVSQR